MVRDSELYRRDVPRIDVKSEEFAVIASEFRDAVHAADEAFSLLVRARPATVEQRGLDLLAVEARIEAARVALDDFARRRACDPMRHKAKALLPHGRPSR